MRARTKELFIFNDWNDVTEVLRVWKEPENDGTMGRCIDEKEGLGNNCLIVNLSYY